MTGKILRFNASLASFLRAGDPNGALLQFRRMHRDGLPLDGFSFTPAFSACSFISPPSLALLFARQLHSLAIKSGSLSAAIPRTALLCSYDKCSSQSSHDALSLFDEMSTRDAISWNALISCLIRHNRAADAVCAFRRMTLEEAIRATEFTLVSLLKACGSLRTLRRGEQIHAAVVVSGNLLDSVVLGTALMGFYSDCGLLDSALRVFDLHLLRNNDEAACNALIAACANNGRHKEAFAVLRAMDLTAPALTAAVTACSNASNRRYGREIHGAAVRRAFTSHSTGLCNALSDMYSRLGEITCARHMFDETPRKDVVSWTSLIRAYGAHGRGAEAWKLFKKMEETVQPNSATCLSAISACAHAGLVDQGVECFSSMKSKHGVNPGSEHEACFVDLLGRAGRMEEVWEVYTAAPEPDIGLSVATLNACAANMDKDRGIQVAKRIVESERLTVAACVALSNFYAGSGMWEKVEESRSFLRGSGVRKVVGCSIRVQ